jgi:hypothetical protein
VVSAEGKNVNAYEAILANNDPGARIQLSMNLMRAFWKFREMGMQYSGTHNRKGWKQIQ